MSPARHPPAPPPEGTTIAVSLITGFLGSGKTTLLNHLLADPRMERTAVLINEFGEVGIDQLIVREIDPSAVLLKSGCICCTVQGELVDGLKELYFKRVAGSLPAFERVAIETTGLADPLAIIACLMRDPLFKHVYALQGVLTTVDAVHGEAQLDRHVEARRQAAIADRLLITKSDLAAEGAVERLAGRLSELNPGARIVAVAHGAVAPSQLFDAERFDLRSRPSEVRRWVRAASSARTAGAPGVLARAGHAPSTPSRHDEHIVSHCVVLEEPVSREAFHRWYDEFAQRRADHLLRVKGILNVRGEARPWIVHCVQATQHSPTRLPAWPDEDRRSRIIFITSDLPGREIEASLRGYLAQWKEEPEREPEQGGEATRGTWLNEAELTRVFAALAREADWVAANAIRLMLLTGAGSEEARTARWEEMDLEHHAWRKRARGRSRPRRFALARPAVMLLRELRRESDAQGGCLFECASGEVPARRLDDVWKRALAAAGVEPGPLSAFRPVLAATLFRGLPDALVKRLLGLAAPRAKRSRSAATDPR